MLPIKQYGRTRVQQPDPATAGRPVVCLPRNEVYRGEAHPVSDYWWAAYSIGVFIHIGLLHSLYLIQTVHFLSFPLRL